MNANTDAEAIYHLRWTRLGLSQVAFADRFGLPIATVRNVEQGRGKPRPLTSLVLAANELDPDFVARAAALVSTRATPAPLAEPQGTEEAAPPSEPEEMRYAVPGVPALRFIRRPVRIAPPEGTLAMLYGENWNSAGWYREGEWLNSRKQPLKRQPLWWVVLDDTDAPRS